MPNRHEMEETSARDARQGETILRSRGRRIVFIVGLAGLVILGLIVSIFA